LLLTKHYDFLLKDKMKVIKLKNTEGRRLIVPGHDSKVGVMKSIIEQTKTTQEEFSNI
jgi:hypothetical protein